MQLEAVLVRVHNVADIARLKRAGAEVWQELGHVANTGGIRWEYAVLRVPAAAAIRMHLVSLDELQEIADCDPAPVTPPRTRRRKSATPTRPPAPAPARLRRPAASTPTATPVKGSPRVQKVPAQSRQRHRRSA